MNANVTKPPQRQLARYGKRKLRRERFGPVLGLISVAVRNGENMNHTAFPSAEFYRTTAKWEKTEIDGHAKRLHCPLSRQGEFCEPVVKFSSVANRRHSRNPQNITTALTREVTR